MVDDEKESKYKQQKKSTQILNADKEQACKPVLIGPDTNPLLTSCVGRGKM